MRKILIFVLIVILVGGIVRYQNKADSVQAPTTDLAPGEYTFTLTHDGEKRSYILFVPTSYNSSPTPLVLFFHGGGGNMEQAKTYDWQTNRPNLCFTYPRA